MTGPYAAYNGEHIGSAAISAADYSQVTGTNKQFYLVSITGLNSAGNGEPVVTLNTTQGAGQVKVMVNGPKQGDPAFLWDFGETKVVAGAAITVGQLVMSDSSGRVIPFVNNGVNVAIGECRLPTINGAGDVITCFMWPSAGFGEVESAISNGLTAHAGGGQASATALVVGWNRLSTVATLGDSAQLPAAVAGSQVIVANDGAANADIYSQNGGTDTIDGVAGSTAVVITAAHRSMFICLTTGAWISLGMTKST